MHKQMVDNNTYNILMALASSLEAHEAYQKYAKDGNQQLWDDIEQHCEQIVTLLQQALPQAMQQAYVSQSQSQSQNQGQQQNVGGTAGYSRADQEDYAYSGDLEASNDIGMGNNGPNADRQMSAANATGTNEDGSMVYEGESQLDYASKTINDPDQRMGYRQPEGTV